MDSSFFVEALLRADDIRAYNRTCEVTRNV